MSLHLLFLRERQKPLKSESSAREGRGNWLSKIIGGLPGLGVSACCDILPFRLEEGLKIAGDSAKAYTDYRKLLDNPNVEAVIISTTLSEHYQMAVDEIDAGKHVYCEKTMTFTFR